METGGCTQSNKMSPSALFFGSTMEKRVLERGNYTMIALTDTLLEVTV